MGIRFEECRKVSPYFDSKFVTIIHKLFPLILIKGEKSDLWVKAVHVYQCIIDSRESNKMPAQSVPNKASEHEILVE
jgi:hypothetical protein